jgi:hypothetical protein
MTSSSPDLTFLEKDLKLDLVERISAAESLVALMGDGDDFSNEDKRIITAAFLKLITPKGEATTLDVDANLLKQKIVHDIIISSSKILLSNYSKRTCDIHIPKYNEDLVLQLQSHWKRRGFSSEIVMTSPVEKECEPKVFYDFYDKQLCLTVTLSF